MNTESVNRQIDDLINQLFELKRELNKNPTESPPPIYPMPNWQRPVTVWRPSPNPWVTVKTWQNSLFTDHSRKCR